MRVLNKALFIIKNSTFIHYLFLSHSRVGGNPPELAAKYPAGTVASVPGTGDSCLRRSDGRDESCGSDVVNIPQNAYL